MGLSREQMARAATGTASVHEREGRYRIRLPRCVNNGKLTFISTGLEVNKENFRKVQTVVWQIDSDIQNGTFDTTLERYQFKVKLTIARPMAVPDLLSLWEGYAEYMEPQVAATTFIKDYRRKYRNRIASLKIQDYTQAARVRNELLETYSADATKRTLEYLAALGRWAMSSGIVETNPYQGLALEIKRVNKDIADIDPFSPLELQAILGAFERHPSHQRYLGLVRFLMLTGCRPGEAIALTWADIDNHWIRFDKSYDGQLKILKDVKNHKPRKFPINGQLHEVLAEVPKGADLVFPNTLGSYLRMDKFTNQVWRGCKMGKKIYKGILPDLLESGKVQRYRPPYNLRHTWITEMLQKGLTVSQAAKLAGNTPDVILKHYASSQVQIELPAIDLGFRVPKN